MAAQKTGSCPHAYWVRDTIHCRVQQEAKAKWDFCKHQYFCRVSNRNELTDNAGNCGLRKE